MSPKRQWTHVASVGSAEIERTQRRNISGCTTIQRLHPNAMPPYRCSRTDFEPILSSGKCEIAVPLSVTPIPETIQAIGSRPCRWPISGCPCLGVRRTEFGTSGLPKIGHPWRTCHPKHHARWILVADPCCAQGCCGRGRGAARARL